MRLAGKTLLQKSALSKTRFGEQSFQGFLNTAPSPHYRTTSFQRYISLSACLPAESEDFSLLRGFLISYFGVPCRFLGCFDALDHVFILYCLFYLVLCCFSICDFIFLVLFISFTLKYMLLLIMVVWINLFITVFRGIVLCYFSVIIPFWNRSTR